jgi:hypothetical protein
VSAAAAVAYNFEEPIKAQIVESTVKARLADANQALSAQLTALAARSRGRTSTCRGRCSRRWAGRSR